MTQEQMERTIWAAAFALALNEEKPQSTHGIAGIGVNMAISAADWAVTCYKARREEIERLWPGGDV